MKGVISGAEENFETHNGTGTDTAFDVPRPDSGIESTTKRHFPGARKDGF